MTADMFISLSDEEARSVELLTKEEIFEALERGREEAKKFLESTGSVRFDPGRYYRRTS